MNPKKIHKNIRRFCRRYRLLLMVSLVMILVFTVAILIPEVVEHQQQPGGYSDFLDALGRRESSNNYAAVNRFGYMGRYQMGGMALKEAGFKDADGAWKQIMTTPGYIGKKGMDKEKEGDAKTPTGTYHFNYHGVYSKEDFLRSPDAQNTAVAAYHAKVCSYIRAYRLDRYIGSTYCGVEVTRSGLLAACHLVGIGSLKKALASGTHAYDGNRTPASEYMKKFGGYDISEVWGE